MSWMVPISLFTAITETTVVSDRTAPTSASVVTIPSSVTSTIEVS